MHLNEIIAADRTIRPLLTTCVEIKLPPPSVPQVALLQVNQTAAAASHCLPRSQLVFSQRSKCSTEPEVGVSRWKSKAPHCFVHSCPSGSLYEITIPKCNAVGLGFALGYLIEAAGYSMWFKHF